MKAKTLLLITTAVLSLAACSQKADTSVPANEAAASNTSAPAEQVLTSSDNKIKVTTTGTQFTELSTSDANNLPAGISANEITLLQRDDNNDITLYAASLGAAKVPADRYFSNLKSTLNNDKALSDVQVGEATENRMNYRFTAHQGDSSLNESCLAIYENKQLYTLCADSNTLSQDELANVLTNVTINQ